MKNKKITTFIIVGACVAIYFVNSKKATVLTSSESVKTHTSTTENSKGQEKIKRELASIKNSPLLKNKETAKTKSLLDSKSSNKKRSVNEKLSEVITQKNQVLSIEEIELVREIPIKDQTVVIIKTNHNKAKSSFKALINNENGEILQTWAQRQHENLLGKHHKKLIHPIYK